MSKKPTTYHVEDYAVNEYALVKKGPSGGRYVLGRYKSKSLAQDIAEALNRAEWCRYR